MSDCDFLCTFHQSISKSELLCEGCGGSEDEGKRLQRREKNRVAAQKSRKRQTQRADLLHQTCELLEQRNRKLRSEVPYSLLLKPQHRLHKYLSDITSKAECILITLSLCLWTRWTLCQRSSVCSQKRSEPTSPFVPSCTARSPPPPPAGCSRRTRSPVPSEAGSRCDWVRWAPPAARGRC
ncbi:basic leucine zipper transcriptional factor ATF-like 3 isoform X1 [Betta splendens]|uniref:Basic leucine zipper transcriptional factor ATF-like 3 isoform X1 n=1 Tax=Betta splendens TaxID=158456 RepID=A0A9W2XLD0_BETSP|nr:basic leucine zipper transcriptional factor ATF-like 3 isoform X1 [Betta splendens]